MDTFDQLHNDVDDKETVDEDVEDEDEDVEDEDEDEEDEDEESGSEEDESEEGEGESGSETENQANQEGQNEEQELRVESVGDQVAADQRHKLQSTLTQLYDPTLKTHFDGQSESTDNQHFLLLQQLLNQHSRQLSNVDIDTNPPQPHHPVFAGDEEELVMDEFE